MKTLYELLEVSEKASKEIIERAYKVLAKKYHPDLQKEEDKEKAEQKMKQINEAYDILSDDIKREKYDEELKAKRQQEELEKDKLKYSQNMNMTANTSQNNANYNKYTNTRQNDNQDIKKQELENLQKEIKNMQNQYEQKYQEAYEEYLRSLGYKIKYKWSWDRVKDLLKTLLIMIIICLIIWFFPPTHKILVNFYESNVVIKAIADIISNTFVGIWNSICSFF